MTIHLVVQISYYLYQSVARMSDLIDPTLQHLFIGPTIHVIALHIFLDRSLSELGFRDSLGIRANLKVQQTLTKVFT
jgi:hypothetical protein